MGTTGAPWNHRYPEGSDPVRLSQYFRNNSEDTVAGLNVLLTGSTRAFANAAARSAAIPSPTNGQLTWLSDTKRLYVFIDGTWYVVATQVGVPTIKGGSGIMTTDANGFFSITHNLGVTPTWAQTTIKGTSAVEKFAKVNVTGLDSVSLACILLHTQTGNAIGGGNVVDMYWTVGGLGANA